MSATISPPSHRTSLHLLWASSLTPFHYERKFLCCHLRDLLLFSPLWIDSFPCSEHEDDNAIFLSYSDFSPRRAGRGGPPLPVSSRCSFCFTSSFSAMPWLFSSCSWPRFFLLGLELMRVRLEGQGASWGSGSGVGAGISTGWGRAGGLVLRVRGWA